MMAKPVGRIRRQLDPWGEYLQRQQHAPRGNLSGPGGQGSVARGSPNLGPLHQGDGVGDGRPQVAGGDVDVLSDDDRRTLITGGWMQDTRRATIEEEAQLLLLNPEIKALVDVEKIAVYGPRRSVGMIKFTQRDGEHSFEEVKSRMWQVIRATAKLKIPVESAKSMGEERAMWASFVKTRTARVRSSHISMVRRVTIGLVSETKDEGGEFSTSCMWPRRRMTWIGARVPSGAGCINSPPPHIASPRTPRRC